MSYIHFLIIFFDMRAISRLFLLLNKTRSASCLLESGVSELFKPQTDIPIPISKCNITVLYGVLLSVLGLSTIKVRDPT